MDIVFPSSREEKCPRDDCESRYVEPLGTTGGFASLNVESPGRAVWLCIMCGRPFKLVREPETASRAGRGRRGPRSRSEG